MATRSDPLYLDDRFGWLHRPAAPLAAGGIGVVLCPAFAQEEVCTHYGLMALADALAAAGLPTMRFDYAGTGDSGDEAIDLAGMTADAVHAADALQQQTGVDRVVFAGVRLGAAIAIRAAAEAGPAAGLALLAPVLSGQTFMRETRASASVASLSGLDPVPPVGSDLPLNTNGFHWTPALQREVAAIDLTGAPAPGCPALFVPARTDKRPAKLAARWREAGVDADEIAFPDYDLWMQDPTTNENPAATFAVVVAWIARLAADGPARRPRHRIAIADRLTVGDAIEAPVRFGRDAALFGIVTRPRGRPAAPVAALLMHEGSTHHIGNGRAYVRLARQLAAAGIVSLRMDLSGMGDSPAGDNARHPHYDPERIAEGRAALDWLAAEGHGRAMSFGLCSGAHTALQVALQDERVAGFVILNLQKFIWHYGDDIRVAVRDNKRSLKAYLRATRNPGEWRRMLAGEADLKGIARVLAKRGVQRTVHGAKSLFPPAPGSEAAQVREQMRALATRGVHGHFVFSDEDPGLPEMWMQFGRRARRLAAYAPARMVMLDRADHHFNGSEARQRYFAIAEAAIVAAQPPASAARAEPGPPLAVAAA